MHLEIDKHDSTWIEEYVGRLVACNMTSGHPSRLSWIPRIKHPRWVLRDDGTALELNDTAGEPCPYLDKAREVRSMKVGEGAVGLRTRMNNIE